MEIFCFFIGVFYGLNPSFYLPGIALLCFYILPKPSLLIFFLFGSIFAWQHQHQELPQGLPEISVIQHATIKGTIVSIPVKNSHRAQFLLRLEEYEHHQAQGLVQLSWYNQIPPLHLGQRWQLNVKLKKPRNFLNPGSMNYTASLAKRHIAWTGYVRLNNNRLLKAAKSFSWLVIRKRLADKLTQSAPNQITAGIGEALTLNLTRYISQEHWELFRRTGTIHLFGISGEHIAFISGLFYFLSKWLWTRSARCCLWLPAPFFAGINGFLAALVYAFLAGFEPPVQRALIGCLFYTVSVLGMQRTTLWQIWRYALFLVLCIEPHALMMQGFYFSFLAVACLLLTQQRWQYPGYKGKLALQLSCLVGLMPLTLYWYAYGSLNGFVANLFAIPLTGFLIMPVALIALVLNSFTIVWIPMHILAWLVTFLLTGLKWTEHLAGMNIQSALPFLSITLALMAGLLIWVVLPVKPLRNLAFLGISLAFFPPRMVINNGEALIHVLDVGQGLAVIVRTQNHVLIYDTGDQFSPGADLGTMVILPYLNYMGIKKIDAIVISHPDKDHWGGLKSIEAAMPGALLLVNEPTYYKRGVKCHNFPQWDWNGVHFRFLATHKKFRDKNNSSCILQIKSAQASLLLPGDIEKEAEDYLVRTYSSELKSDILVLAHHGSKTSTSYRFLLETSPKYAIASLGFDNRFHFPHARTLEHLHALNIPLYQTDQCGMVEILLPAKGQTKAPACFSQNSYLRSF